MNTVLTNPYAGSTFTTPLSIFILIVSVCLFYSLSYGKRLLPFVLVMCTLPHGLRIVIGGMDFTLIRLFILVAWISIILRKEYLDFKQVRQDTVIICYSIVSIMAGVIRSGSFSSLITGIGVMIDTLGLYFLLRICIKDKDSIIYGIKVLAVFSIILSGFFIYEHSTGINLFSYVGGVPYFSAIRNGEYRARAAFAHPISAGAFWACCIPLFWGIKDFTSKKILIVLGIISSFAIIFSVASSTPIMSVLPGLFMIPLYKYRKQLSRFKALVVLMIIFIQLLMERPFWFIITRIDLTGSSSSWYRAVLFDEYVKHFKDWFFVGIDSTYYWNANYNFGSVGLADVANQYVAEGVSGGIIRLLLFLIIIKNSWLYLEEMFFSSKKKDCFFYWCFAASLIVHLFNFIGLGYFGQITNFWYMTLAFITSLYAMRVNE